MPRASVEAERREQIMAAACEVIADIGYRSLRVADVASRACTSTGTVHYYFDTKRDLMRAALEWSLTQSLQHRRGLLDSGDDAATRLRAFAGSFLPGEAQDVTAWRVWAELRVEALHDLDLQEVNEMVYGEWRRVVAAVIRDGQDAGQFRMGDPVLLANALIGMIDGLSLQVLLNSRSMSVGRMRAVFDEVLETVVARPPAEPDRRLTRVVGRGEDR